MNICSNPEEQEHFSLTKCRKVADRIQEVKSRHRQEIGNLGCNEWTSHSNEGRAPTSSTPGVCTTITHRDLLSPPTHDLSSKISKTNAPRSEYVHLLESRARFWDYNLTDRHLAFSVAPKEQAKHAKGKGEARKCLTQSDGRISDSSAQRLVLSKALDKEMVQADKCSFVFSKLIRLG